MYALVGGERTPRLYYLEGKRVGFSISFIETWTAHSSPYGARGGARKSTCLEPKNSRVLSQDITRPMRGVDTVTLGLPP